MSQTKIDFTEYSDRAYSRAVYPNKGRNLFYVALGLAGESGEFCEKLKKYARDSANTLDFSSETIPDQIKSSMKKELGDVLWYVNAAAHELGITLDDVALTNLEKVDGRHDRGTLHGSGDDR